MLSAVRIATLVIGIVLGCSLVETPGRAVPVSTENGVPTRVVVSVSDLDLASERDVGTLRRRVRRAAHKVCGGNNIASIWARYDSCYQSVLREAERQVGRRLDNAYATCGDARNGPCRTSTQALVFVPCRREGSGDASGMLCRRD
jgi:UrcA family protein